MLILEFPPIFRWEFPPIFLWFIFSGSPLYFLQFLEFLPGFWLEVTRGSRGQRAYSVEMRGHCLTLHSGPCESSGLTLGYGHSATGLIRNCVLRARQIRPLHFFPTLFALSYLRSQLSLASREDNTINLIVR